jgi:mRNA-degrading endonuclease YafQ of YafQ-DinJ toxin-antitoxin module
MKIVFTSAFKRVLKKHIRRDPDLDMVFRKKIAVFQNDPYDPSLQTHKLKGTLAGSLAFSLTYKLRIVFKFTAEGYAQFSDIGTHDEVY